MEVKTLVLTGYGINSDFELQNAFSMAGAKAERVHFNEVLAKNTLGDYHILAIPGGFSFGDDISSGKVFANKLKFKLKTQLQEFVDEGKLIIGICNGFQILVKAGLLPDTKTLEQTTTLTFNDSGHFEDRWVYLKNEDAKSVWAKGIKQLQLPVRHGEGKFYTDPESLKRFEKNRQVAFKYFNPLKQGAKQAEYPWNPNGSLDDIAALSNESGRVLGIMPHPEAFIFPQNHPQWTRGETKAPVGEGLKLFQNAVDYAAKKLA